MTIGIESAFIPRVHKKPRVPDERSVKMNNILQEGGVPKHKMDPDIYSIGKLILTSDDEQQLHEAILVAENFLSYNGSFDFERKSESKNECTILFKWNGCLSMYDSITKKIKLPTGVNHCFELLKTYYLADIHWLTEAEGGRIIPPYGAPKYAPIIGLPKDVEGTWSIIFEVPESPENNEIMFCFLADKGPRDAIVVGESYDLFEGPHKVASIKVTKRGFAQMI